MSLIIDLWPVAPHPLPSTPTTTHTHCASHFLSHQLQLGLFNFHFKVVGCFFYIYISAVATVGLNVTHWVFQSYRPDYFLQSDNSRTKHTAAFHVLTLLERNLG